MPPAARLEVRQRARAPVEPVLRLAIPEHVHIPGLGVDDSEGSAGILLVAAILQAQRVVAEPPEADVGQPRLGPLDPKSHVVIGNAEARLTDDSGLEQRHLISERAQQPGESAVQLIAEAASAPPHQLVDQRSLVQDDRLPQVDAQVLERDGAEVAQVQVAQGVVSGVVRPLGAEPVQVGADRG